MEEEEEKERQEEEAAEGEAVEGEERSVFLLLGSIDGIASPQLCH